jgi:hydrogenase nickel incorporation protein HypA/HybF
LHETSIALSILSAVEDVYKQTPGARRVTAIRIRVGMLSLIDIEALKFALKVASRGTPAENARIEVKIETPRFRCRKCGYEWELSREKLEEITEEYGLASVMHIYPDVILEYMKCPRCGSTDIEILEGRGVILESIELDVEDERKLQ